MARKNSHEGGLRYMKFAALALAVTIGLLYTKTIYQSVSQGQLLGITTLAERGRNDGEQPGKRRGQESQDTLQLQTEDIIITTTPQIKRGRKFVEPIDLGSEDVDVATDEGSTIVPVKLRSGFPLSIDTETNELIVTTPAGVKRVTVLPEVAVLNMLRLRKIDEVVGGDDEEATEEGDLEEGTDEAELTEVDEVEGTVDIVEENGEIVYEVEGVSNQNFAGVAPVKIKKKLTISSTTGDVINEEISLLQRILDLLSI